MNEARLEALLALERDVKAELEQLADEDRSKKLHNHWPVTDGVVDEALYLTASPKMLWILKESWEPGIEDGGGDFSTTKDLISRLLREGTLGNRGLYSRMAYVSYSVLHGYPDWRDIPWVSDDPKVGESLKSIAYINVSKYPGKTKSYDPFIRKCYQRNQRILLRQIETIAPDVIIGGGTLPLFFNDFGLTSLDFANAGSVDVCYKGGRLYIDAYHPAYWSISAERYVGDIVAAVKQHRQNWEPAASERDQFHTTHSLPG